MSAVHYDHVNFIWAIANLLRGPYRPPQYRKVMLPLTVLRRLDCVLAPTKDKVIAEHTKLKTGKLKEDAIEKTLKQRAGHQFYNTSPLTFEKMVAAHESIAADLKSYINGFSSNARRIIEKFGFEEQIDKLDDTNRLYPIMQEFAKMDLSPKRVKNTDMGYIFEELIRKFNEQANEEAGDHFTPREVIRLMAHLLYTPDDEVFNQRGLLVKVYDPACGTGGMLSVSEEYLREHSEGLNIELFGQEYNDESWAICSADMLIKAESPERIILGDTFGDGKTEDGYPNETFHYMLANPPFGVEWKPEEKIVRKEHETFRFDGRFGAGLPRINDGSLLFLQHMISKMEPPPVDGGRGSRIAIVFNGSPLFTGDAGSGESNIRKWIIENDWLEAVVALPDQLFYNTGIYTYIWIVTNRKSKERRGTVQLVNAAGFCQKMRKSLGNKRNEIGDGREGKPDHISAITRLYGDFKPAEQSRIFANREFGYAKITVERPLRLNFRADAARIARLWEQSAFKALAESKKRKDKKEIEAEELAGRQEQNAIVAALKKMDADRIYLDREEFLDALDRVLNKAKLKVAAPVRKAIINVLSERDPEANICRDAKGNIEPDTDLRDTENVPLPKTIQLPIKDEDLPKFIPACEEYLKREVLPHVPDAWIDHSKTKVGYEIPFNRHFYTYVPPRPLEDIERDIKAIEQDILRMLAEVTA